MHIRLYLSTLFFLVLTTHAQMSNQGKLFISTKAKMSIAHHFVNAPSSVLVNNGELNFQNNLTNNGAITYTVGKGGNTIFNGKLIQQLRNSGLLNLYKVTFDHAKADPVFEVFGKMNVDHSAVFLKGIVETEKFGGRIFFTEDANYIVSPSHESFINGRVFKIGNTEFSFPIGNIDSYRKLKISAPDELTDVFSAQYFKLDSNAFYPHKKAEGVIEFIDKNEYWTLQQERGDAKVMITLTWEDGITSPQILSGDYEQIHIVRWDAKKGFWIDEGGVVDISNKSVRTITTLKEYGTFTLARVKKNAVLPGNIKVYNGFTPNGDGVNDFLRIEGLDAYSNNRLEIFNRWGVLVYETEGYNSTTNTFKGVSEGRITIGKGEKLPTGTYFYVLNYDYNGEMVKKQGYVYINAN